MSLPVVLLPLFVQVLLTFGLWFWMAWHRTGAIRRRTVHMRDIALREPNWPKPALQAAYSYANQFELPVLFYVAVILAIITRHADIIEVALAWVFVLCRYVQAFIHVTSNQVRHRAIWFGLSALAAMIMWIWLAFQIFVVAPAAGL